MTIRSEKVSFAGSTAGVELAGRLERPPGTPAAWVLFAHCFTCSKDIAAASRISRALGQKGFGVLRFDFTGLGSSGGDFAHTNFSSNVQDLVAAAAWLREHHQAPALLVGHSLGGAAVLTAAAELPEVQAVATIGAPSDPAHVQHLFAGRMEEIESEGSAVVSLAGRDFRIARQFVDDIREQRLGQLLPKLDKATLILHSPEDEVVDVDHARKLYQALRHPKSFVSLAGADHLLTRKADSEYVADVLAAWSQRYVTRTEEDHAVESGQVLVEGHGSRFQATVEARSHRWLADEPEKVGGDDTGPTPYDLLLGALGACTSMTLGMYARHKKIPLEDIAVRLSHERVHAEDCADCETRDGRLEVIRVDLELGGPLDQAQRRRLVEISERCPVHRTLKGNKEIITRLVD